MPELTCPVCGIQFDPANRASPEATEGAVGQMVYCSRRCKRRATNKRHYRRHRAEIIKRVLKNQGYN